MKTPSIEVEIFMNPLLPDKRFPQYKTAGAAGFDIAAYIPFPGNQTVYIPPKAVYMVRTGLHAAVPEGYELQIRPRSGMVKNHGLTVANSPGTIDSDYRGEIMILLFNISEEHQKVSDGDRVAQGVIAEVPRCNLVRTLHHRELEVTARGAGGFGSTGVKT